MTYTKKTDQTTQPKKKIDKSENEKDIQISSNSVNDAAVRKLLNQKEITGLQIGRILFLNICEMIEGKKQLYTYEEYIDLISLLAKKNDDDEIRNFIFYQRLTTYAVNELNEMIIRNKLSLKGFKYLYSELSLYEINNMHQLDYSEINSTINDIRLNLQYINSYALFYDAMKKMLKDPKLKTKYRISHQAEQVINEAKKYDEFIKKQDKIKELKLIPIGEEPRIYTEHIATEETVNDIIKYLKNTFDPTLSSGDNITTSDVAKYINNHYPRN